MRVPKITIHVCKCLINQINQKINPITTYRPLTTPKHGQLSTSDSKGMQSGGRLCRIAYPITFLQRVNMLSGSKTRVEASRRPLLLCGKILLYIGAK